MIRTRQGRTDEFWCRLSLGIFLLSTSALGQAAPALPSTPSSGSGTAAQSEALSPAPAEAPTVAEVSGFITDTDAAAIPGARVLLEDAQFKILRQATAGPAGEFSFQGLGAGSYNLKISAKGFSSWKVDGLTLRAGETRVLTTITLGVEALSSSVNAITVEDLAEQQISAESRQRILGILPNFYVSYVPHAAPLTRKQKFKLAIRVSDDPVTFFTNGITAGIEQAQGELSGYGPGFGGYATRFAASYGDRVTATFFGAALLPSLFHQDPRYFYKGTGSLTSRALYAVSTVVICKGDNGHWQPNYSNVLGNLAAGGLSTLYYPRTDQHSVQVTVDNTLIGTATGAFGTLFQEFLLKHLTHGVPKGTP